jgi:hypothetical protein
MSISVSSAAPTKKTPATKAAEARERWAEKGDPYTCLDFQILILKNPKVKPPGFTERDIATYFGGTRTTIETLESELSGLTESLRKRNTKKSKGRSSRYGGVTSTLSTWVSKKPATTPIDTETFMDTLPPPILVDQPEEVEEKPKQTSTVKDWRQFGRKQRSKREEKKLFTDTVDDETTDSHRGIRPSRTSPRVTSPRKVDINKRNTNSKADGTRVPEKTPIKERPQNQGGTPPAVSLHRKEPQPPKISKPKYTPTRAFGHRGVKKTKPKTREDFELEEQEAKLLEEKLSLNKKAYTPSLWKMDDKILPPRYKTKNSNNKDALTEEEEGEIEKIKIEKAAKKAATVTSWRKELSKSPRTSKTFSRAAGPPGPNIQARVVDTIGNSSSQVPTFMGVGKSAIRVLTPLFTGGRNRPDETSIIQALESLDALTQNPHGAIVLGNLNIFENFNSLLASKHKLSFTIVGKIYDLLGNTTAMYAKLGSKQPFLNAIVLGQMVEHIFCFVAHVAEDGSLHSHTDTIGKTYEVSAMIEAVASATVVLKSLVEFFQRSESQASAQHNFVVAGGLHVLLILSYCTLKRAGRIARVILQRFELKELMQLQSSSMNLDFPIAIIESDIMNHFEPAMKEETLKRIERSRRESAVVRNIAKEANQATPKTQDADERRERLNSWLDKREAQTAEERRKFQQQKLHDEEVQKEIDRLAQEKFKVEAQTRAAIAEKQRMLLFARHDESKKGEYEMKRRELLLLEEETRRREEENEGTMKSWLQLKKKKDAELNGKREREAAEARAIQNRALKRRMSIEKKNIPVNPPLYTEFNR